MPLALKNKFSFFETKSVNNRKTENRNDPDLIQAFLKKWWIELDFKVPNLPLSLRLKGSGCQWKKKYSCNVRKSIFDMRANQDHILVLIRIKPDI
jgi:hypothetical protein